MVPWESDGKKWEEIPSTWRKWRGIHQKSFSHPTKSYTFWRIIRSGDVYTKRSGWQPGRYQWKKTSQRKKSSIVAQRLCAALSDFFFHYKYLKTFKERGMLINYIISYITMHEDYAVVEVTWRHRYLLFFYYHIHPVKPLSLQAPVFVIFNSCN